MVRASQSDYTNSELTGSAGRRIEMEREENIEQV
jgi:hypothetical protein